MPHEDDFEQVPQNPLKSLRTKNLNKMMIGHLNINSVRNKFQQFEHFTNGYVDVMLLSETKIDDSFTNAQFKMSGFHVPFRKDRNKHGGGLLMYVNDEIVCTQQVVPSLPSDIEALFVEINLRKQKWLIAGIYRPPSQDISYFVGVINETLLYSNYENIILIDDFNALESHEKIQTFNTELDLKNLIHQPACYKSVTNPSCIDHI